MMHEYYYRNWNFFSNFDYVNIYAVDPGAWSVLRPLARFLEDVGHFVHYLLEGWSEQANAGKLAHAGVSVLGDLETTPLDKNHLFVFGSQRDFHRNYRAVRLSREAGAGTLFVFDSWKNYRINFVDPITETIYLPDRIAVSDEYMREELIKSIMDFVPNKYDYLIDIIGHPGIDSSLAYISSIQESEKSQINERYNPRQRYVKLFIMEPIREDFILVNNIDPGYDEFAILQTFLETACCSNDRILIKCHPRQDIQSVVSFSEESGYFGKYDIEMIKEEKIERLIAISDEVYGMTSIALIVAIHAGVTVYSIQSGRNEYGKSLSHPKLEKRLIL